MTQIVTLRLDEELVGIIDKEADARGLSRSEYLRNQIANTHDYDRNQNSNTSDYERLRQRVVKLEESVYDTNTGDYGSADDSDDGLIPDSVDIPGDDATQKRKRRSWLAECLDWTQSQGEWRRADVVAYCDDPGALGYDTDDGLWVNLVKPTVDELVANGDLEKPTVRSYRWQNERD